MVLTLMVPLRKVFGLEDFITAKHLDNMGKVMLVTGLIVGYGYVMEIFTAWYSGNLYEIVRDAEPDLRALRGSSGSCSSSATSSRSSRSGSASTAQPGRALDDLDVRQRRHVARALRDHPD